MDLILCILALIALGMLLDSFDTYNKNKHWVCYEKDLGNFI